MSLGKPDDGSPSKKMRMRFKSRAGYTMIELMLVVAIMSILGSIMTPRIDQLLQKAYQSKAKGNLGSLRSTLTIYYSEQEGHWPLAAYPEGDGHYTGDNLSMSGILVPKYTDYIFVPKLVDRMLTYNGLSVPYDEQAEALMAMSPPKDVYILWSPPDYTPMLNSPYAYNNQSGWIYYPNGNYDSAGRYFYEW